MVLLPQTGQGWVIEVHGEDWFFDPLGRLIGRPDPDAYDPCWCQSGAKFRFCHMLRHRQPRVTRGEFLDGWEAASDFEMCLHPLAPEGCSVTVVRAHTVQRMGGGLRTIAAGGEVYGFKAHPYFIQKNDFRVVPERIGTRKASTFRGFCEAHDGQLFRAAEDKPFSATLEQIAMLNFRVVARRLFGRHVSLRHAPKMLEYDRGLPPVVQREWFAINHRDVIKARVTLENTRLLKLAYDQLATRRDFAEVNAYLAYFEGPPDFLTSELVNPDFSFDGQRLDEPPPPAHLCAYNIATETGWVFVFAWNGRNSAAEALTESFDRVSPERKASLLLAYALEYTDNLFFAPAWYESLAPQHAAALVESLTGRMHPHYVRSPEVFVRTRIPMRSCFVRSTRIGPWAAAA
jgi:hypothetical protein